VEPPALRPREAAPAEPPERVDEGIPTVAPEDRAEAQAVVERIEERPHVGLFRKQEGGMPGIYFTAHMEFPQFIQILMQQINDGFHRGDYLYRVDINAYWRLSESLDMLMAWVSSQVDVKKIMAGDRSGSVLDAYFRLEDEVDTKGRLVAEKVNMIGAAMQLAGLTLKERDTAWEPVPADRMASIFTLADDIRAPSPVDLEKYGVAQVAAYWRENMIDVGLDIFCVIETPRKIYPYGSGKSTLGLQIGGATARAIGDAFDIRRDVVYQMDFPRLQRFFEDHDRRQVRMVDESKFFWYRRTAMSGSQKRDMMTLSMTRKDEQVWLASASNVFRLDQDIFEEKATHILRVTDPGRVTVRRGWGQATLYEKADQDEEEDRWGRPVLSVKWVDFPSGSGPKAVYGECIRYTNRHARHILDDGVSPLDALLDDDPEWQRDQLRGWLPEDSAESEGDSA